MKHLWNSRWKKAVSILACVVVFSTTYALVLPAITAEAETFCGLDEHTHSDECYSRELICGFEEGAAAGSGGERVLIDEGHRHSKSCYGSETVQICGQEERGPVTETVYHEGVTREITLEDGTVETVTDEGWEETVVVDEGHVHTSGCFEVQEILVCGQEEHEPVYGDEAPAEEEHVHTEKCYREKLTCGKEEHVHTDICFSDRNADLENAVQWEATLPAADHMTGVWAEDIITVAKSQLGYRESTRNFAVEDGERKGYTRYGAMQGYPYGDWSAMFIQFCLHYTGISGNDLPACATCDEWVQLLCNETVRNFTFAKNYARNENTDAYDEDFDLRPGDIVFFDFKLEGTAGNAGIVTSVNTKTAADPETGKEKEIPVSIETIEGDSGNGEVRTEHYDLSDRRIYGFAKLPERPDSELMDGMENPENTAHGTSLDLYTMTETGVLVNVKAAREAFGEGINTERIYIVAKELTGEEECAEFEKAAKRAAGDDRHEYADARYFDIDFMNEDDGSKVELPEGTEVNVEISFDGPIYDGNGSGMDIISFSAEGAVKIKSEDIMDGPEAVGKRFNTVSPLVFGAVRTNSLQGNRRLSFAGEDYVVTVKFSDKANIPAGAVLKAEEIKPGTEQYKKYVNDSEKAIDLGEHQSIEEARFFDITILDPEGNEVEPDVPVRVSVEYDDPYLVAKEDTLHIVHFAEDGTELIDADISEEMKNGEAEDMLLSDISFNQSSFSVTGIMVSRELTGKMITAKGAVYNVTVTYYPDAEIPEGATLSLTEYDAGSAEYEEIKELHQPIIVPGALNDEEKEEQIDSLVRKIMEEQRQSMENLMSNGDMGPSDFEMKSEAEIRAGLEEYFSDKGVYQVSGAGNAASDDELSLIDITILDKDGNEVEPKAEVTVEIVMESIPENTTGNSMKNTLQVEHYVEKDGALESEIVVSPDASAGEIWVTGEDVVKAAFTTDSFSFYTLAWNQHDDTLDLDVMRLSVYYGFLINDTFREFRSMSWAQARYAEENTTGGADPQLINGKDHVYELKKDEWVTTRMSDFRNYSFAKAVIRRDGYNGGEGNKTDAELDEIAIDPVYGGPVIIGNETDGYTVTLKKGGTYRLGNADSIYVIFDSPYGEGVDFNYAKDSTPETPVLGGSNYGLDSDGNPEGLGVPEHTKTLSENTSSNNPDNTYRLSLTATGKRKITKDNTKADVLLVLDGSGSMKTNNYAGYNKLANAVNSGLLPSLRELEQKYGEGTIEISAVRFGHFANVSCANVPLSNYSFSLDLGGATNYEDAFMKLGTIRTRADARQYVIFITDGNPTVRNSKGDIRDWSDESNLYGHGYYNNEYIWTYMENKWQWKKIDDITPDPDANWYQNMGIYGKGVPTTGHVRDCYNVTVPYVQTLVNNNVDFSVIATLSDATIAKQMVNVGNAAKPGSSHYYYADNTEAIKSAFNNILESINSDLSYKFVSIDDEMSAVAETTLVETPEDFEYFKYPSHIRFVNNMTDKTPDTHSSALAVDEDGNAVDAEGLLCSESGKVQAKRSDFRWEDAPEAVYVPGDGGQNGSVSWPLNTVEVHNETFEVTFTVYPNQYGWDMITTLANHWNDPDFDWLSVSAEKVVNTDGSVDIYEVVWDESTDTFVRTGKKLLSTDSSGNVSVASNDEASLTYMTVHNKTVIEDGQEHTTKEEEGPFTTKYDVPYMSVEPSDYKIRKIWKDTLVPRWPIEEVDLEIWYVSKGDVDAGDGWYMDSDTGDYTDKSSIAYVDNQNVVWYWAAKAEDMTLNESVHQKGYINIHEPNENLGDVNGYGSSKVTVSSFMYMKNNGMIDSENYRINASGERLRNANGNLIQYFAYWEVNKAIAPGLIATSISPEPLPGARGHYYALREMDTAINQGGQFEQHFELESDVVRPIKRDGVMESASGRLSGTNSRKGELAITKMALTQDRHEINPDVPFQVTVLLTGQDGSTLNTETVIDTGERDENNNPVYETIYTPRTDIEYLVYDASGNVVDIDSINGSNEGAYTIGVTKEDIDAGAGTSAHHKTIPYDGTAEAHKLVFSKLYPDWTVVIVNLPTNTKWSVQETYNTGIPGAAWMNGITNGYQFEGYTLPDAKRGHDTLHPQPHFVSDRAHYSGGTVGYNEDGTVNESGLITITDFEDASNILDANGEKVSAADGSAAKPILGYIEADAEELVDIHNIRTTDDMEIKKIDAVTKQPLSGARFALESLRPQTEWRIHTEYDSAGNATGKYWAETYVFESGSDDPVMTETMGPAHYPASVHIHGTERYVVRGDVIGSLYAKDGPDQYTPIPLDRDGNEIGNVKWVTVSAGDVAGLTPGVHYVEENGNYYILRRSTRKAGAYEKVPDTTDPDTHVYYYIESGSNGLLIDPDPNHMDKLKELPIIAGDHTVYNMYELEAPQGYLTVLEQLRLDNPDASWEDSAFVFNVTSSRAWNGQTGTSQPYIELTNPITGNTEMIWGVWDETNKHWDFNFSIEDKKAFYELELKKIKSTTNIRTRINHDSLKLQTGTPSYYINVLATGEGQLPETYQGEWGSERGKSRILAAGYDRVAGMGRIDSEGYLLTADNSERLVDANGNYVLYRPIACEHIDWHDHTAECFISGIVETVIDDAGTAGFEDVRFSLFEGFEDDAADRSRWYYNESENEPKNYKNVLNHERDVVTVAEYEKLKNGTSSSGNHIDADGFLVDALGARVQHDGKDVLYIPNYYITGSEAGLQFLKPAVNKAGTTLIGLSTDAEGRIDFGKLAPGTYWLIEQTPHGYVKAKPTKITVSAEGITYKNVSENAGAVQEAIGHTETVTQGNKTYTTTVYEMVLNNTPENLVLPSTGGSGDLTRNLGILVLLAVGAMVLVHLRLQKLRYQKSRRRK